MHFRFTTWWALQLISLLCLFRNSQSEVKSIRVTRKTKFDSQAQSNCSFNDGNCDQCLGQLNTQGIGLCGFCHISNSNCSDASQCLCLPGGVEGPSASSCDRGNWYYEACPDEPTDKTATYRVSVRLLNVAGVNFQSGTFSADFLLFFEGNRVAYTERECNSDDGVCFNILNSVGAPIVAKYHTYFHVQGTFSFEVDLSEYPFDNQTLPLLIQDSYDSAANLQWKISDSKPHASGIDSHLAFSGWAYDANSWEESLSQRYNPILLENFSTYVFKFLIKRPQTVGFIKGLLPPLFIVLVICASFSLPAKEMGSRIWIGGSLLISVVLFHSTLAEETPRRGQLTFADRFIISVYVFIFLSLAVNIIVIRLFRSGKEGLANIVQGLSELTSWPGLFIYFFCHFYLSWNILLVLFLVTVSSLLIILCFLIYPYTLACSSSLVAMVILKWGKKQVGKEREKEGLLEENTTARDENEL